MAGILPNVGVSLDTIFIFAGKAPSTVYQCTRLIKLDCIWQKYMPIYKSTTILMANFLKENLKDK